MPKPTSLTRFLTALEPYANHPDGVFELIAYPVDLPLITAQYSWRKRGVTKEQPARTAICYWGRVRPGLVAKHDRGSQFTILFDQNTGAYIVGTISRYPAETVYQILVNARTSHNDALSSSTTLSNVLEEIARYTPESVAGRRAEAEKFEEEQDERRLNRLAAQADEARKKREDLSKKVNAAVPDFIDITDPRWQLVLNAIIPIPDVI